MLTNARAREDYVKAIFQLGDGEPVAAAGLARYLRISRAAVTKFRRVLERAGFVRKASGRTDPLALTARGRDLASGMLRRHRLLETFLHRSLGYSLDELHAQAEAIEHAISDDMADRLERFLGRPQVDPHGHPIPSVKRVRPRAAGASLAAARAGSHVCVVAIPDRDPTIVRSLIAEHVVPGLTARVVDRSARAITLRSTVRDHVVASAVAPAILVRIRRPRGRG